MVELAKNAWRKSERASRWALRTAFVVAGIASAGFWVREALDLPPAGGAAVVFMSALIGTVVPRGIAFVYWTARYAYANSVAWSPVRRLLRWVDRRLLSGDVRAGQIESLALELLESRGHPQGIRFVQNVKAGQLLVNGETILDYSGAPRGELALLWLCWAKDQLTGVRQFRIMRLSSVYDEWHKAAARLADSGERLAQPRLLTADVFLQLTENGRVGMRSIG
jgi:hypothetical protein